jgi:hypothetical protein
MDAISNDTTKADQSDLQGLLWEALSRAIEHHSWALAEYQDQIASGSNAHNLELFRVALVEPSLRECERLRALIARNPDLMGDEGERRLVEQLETCHQENLVRSHELSAPRRSMLAPEHRKLEEKAAELQTKCHEVRLALREYRKRRLSATEGL